MDQENDANLNTSGFGVKPRKTEFNTILLSIIDEGEFFIKQKYVKYNSVYL